MIRFHHDARLRVRTAVIASCLTMITAAAAVAQQGGWYPLTVPGGRATLRSLGMDNSRDRAFVMIDLIRRLHFSTQKPAALETALRKLPLAAADSLTLPSPLSVAAWEKVFRRSVQPSRLFGAILNDRNARLLYHGLTGLDAPTREWFEQHPELLRALYRNGPAAQSFALFAPAIQVHANRIQVAGDDRAARAWSAVLGRVDDPEAYVRKLFLDRQGRVAGLYFLSAFVEPSRRLWLFGEGRPGAERFSALVSSFAECYPAHTNDYPFVLRSKDPAWLLLNINLTDAGAPAGPRTRVFWDAVFADEERPLANPPTDDTPIDAAWLVDRLCGVSTVARSAVFETLLAGHRLFTRLDAAEQPAAIRALRVRRLYPSIFVAMERAGVGSPQTIGAMARQAERLHRLSDSESAPSVLQQFQGALAIVLAAIKAETLDEASGRKLLLSLSDLTLRGDRFDGALARWFEATLVPALGSALAAPPALTIEDLVARALGGPPSRSARRVEWEGLPYVLDYSGWTRDRLLRVRSKQGGETLDAVLTRARNAKSESAIQAADTALGQVLASWAYAPHLGDAISGALIGGDPSRRHDLGVRAINSTRFDQRWEVAIAAGDRGVIAGSYLGLDAALAPWSLKRLALDRIPAPPTIADNDRSSLVSTVALSDPRRLADADMHRIAEAARAGERTIESAGPDLQRLQEFAEIAALSPWRRHLLSWMAVEEPDRIAGQFSLTARARIGGLQTAELEAWGSPAVPLGCLCLRAPFAGIPELLVGRPVDGIVGAYSADLTVRIAELLTELELPAQLTTAVMAYALRDYIDGVRPAHPADVDAYAREAPRLTRLAVEDYVGAIAAVGPLRPAPRQ